MTDRALRGQLIRLAHAKPELRPILLPLLVEGSTGKQANILSDLWQKYKDKHPNAKSPPDSLREKAKKMEDDGDDPFAQLAVSEKKMRERDKERFEKEKQEKSKK